MTLSVVCPHCSASFEAPAEAAGKPRLCPGCGKPVVVPRSAPTWNWDAEEAFGGKQRWDLRFGARLVATALGLALGSVALFAGFFWVLLPLLGVDAESMRRIEVQKKLRRIAEALRDYHDDYGTLPPPVVYDDQGTPLHSWRALLIPYFDGHEQWGHYDYTQAWDSPANSGLLAEPFEPFLLPPNALSRGLNHTGFMVVIGPDTMFPSTKQGLPLSAAIDGTDRTVLVVEVADSRVHWLEPKDLDQSQLVLKVNGDPAKSPSDPSAPGAWVVWADGRVGFLPNNTSPVDLGAALTAAGGEDRP